MVTVILLAVLSGSPQDLEVARILRGAEDFSPAQFSKAMTALEALGAPAVPGLAARLDDERGVNTLWTICEALSRVPGEAALPAIERRLNHESDLVRSACSRAFGACLVKGGRTPERMKRIRALIATGSDCGMRLSAAQTIGPLEDPELRGTFEALLERPGCDRQVALFGLSSARKNVQTVASRVLAIAQDAHEDAGTRGAAIQTLGDLGWAPARPLLRSLMTGKDPGMNIRSFAIDALGKVGTPDDLELLKAVVASDPYHGEGVWAVSGREAIARIQRRQR